METYFVLMIIGGIVFILCFAIMIVNFSSMFSKMKIGKTNIIIHLAIPLFSGVGAVTFIIGTIWWLIEVAKG